MYSIVYCRNILSNLVCAVSTENWRRENMHCIGIVLRYCRHCRTMRLTFSRRFCVQIVTSDEAFLKFSALASTLFFAQEARNKSVVTGYESLRGTAETASLSHPSFFNTRRVLWFFVVLLTTLVQLFFRKILF